ncbi:MAG: hypothetical protein EXS13_09855 [Planctomycetes bacterium]|nr:hypothetical protein [Planctomycetota bacterium]
MNSPDEPFKERFNERIADAARSLRRPAPPGLFERALAAAHDADTAHVAAARSLTRPTPFTFAQVMERAGADGTLTELDERTDLDQRIDAAARSLVRSAPAGMLAAIRRGASSRPLLRLSSRTALVLAASLVAAFALFFSTHDDDAAPAHPALLAADALRQSSAEEAALTARADTLAAQFASNPTRVDEESQSPLLEELTFLESAIEECRDALSQSQAHRYLRDQLKQLNERRLELLAQLSERGT